MYDLGDEFTLENHRIPWLVWIQLLVTCLLLLLLYYFSISALNLSGRTTTTAAETLPSSFSNSRLPKSYGSHTNNPRLTIKTCSLDAYQVTGDQSIIEETETSTHREVGRRGDIQQGKGSLIKDATHFTLLGLSHHLCHYLGIAKQIFLKCFGLDYTSTPCNNGKEN